MPGAPNRSSAPDLGSGIEGDGAQEPVDLARRRLLRAGRYVAPAILGVIVLQNAGCQPGPSCNPIVCPPDRGCNPDLCSPDTGPCGPDQCPPNN